MLRFPDEIAKMSLDQKIALLSGKDFWHTVAIDDIGLGSMRLSDGPAGVRGESFDERKPSISLPSASTLSSTWDEGLAHQFGEVAASEAIDKEVQVVLGPTINLHRSPLGGRHFEAYSEDPLLTGKLASAFVRGVQSREIGACPKHYVANDSETERFTLDAVVDEQTLHELYLKPFKIAVDESQPWMLMSAYNAVNGHYMSESPLLNTPLKSDWGFDGVVVSDWTAVRTVESAATGQDLVMPGPITPWNQGLKEAVLSGSISEEAIDDKVDRILLLAQRVGKFQGKTAPKALPKAERIEIARKISEQGMVLLKNQGILPLKPGVNIAVSGDSANRPRIQGGGSAQVVTEQLTSPLEALSKAMANGSITYSLGAELLSDCATFSAERMTNPETLEPGCLVRFFDESGKQLGFEYRKSTMLIWNDDLGYSPDRVEVEFILDVSDVTTEDFAIGAATVNKFELQIDDETVVRRDILGEYHDLAEATLQPPTLGTKISLNGRKSLRVKAIVTEAGVPEAHGAVSIMVGEVARNEDPRLLIAQAAEAASRADVAIVVVGTNSAVESEGFDRKSIKLPGYQDDLVRAVARANLNTVVVVNAGSPVDMPWRDEVAAILVCWFGGQELGPALSNVLLGNAEPSGRLPTTWNMSDEAVPLSTTPVDGKLHYTEGLNIGYRSASRSATFPFGAGLGYGDWSLLSAKASVVEGSVQVLAEISNSGPLPSKGFCQVFAAKSDSEFVRPSRWLVGWGRTRPAVGIQLLEISIPLDQFESYFNGWQLESGTYQLQVALNAGDQGRVLEIQI